MYTTKVKLIPIVINLVYINNSSRTLKRMVTKPKSRVQKSYGISLSFVSKEARLCETVAPVSKYKFSFVIPLHFLQK